MCLDSTMAFFSLYIYVLLFDILLSCTANSPNMDLVLVIDEEKLLVATISPPPCVCVCVSVCICVFASTVVTC